MSIYYTGLWFSRVQYMLLRRGKAQSSPINVRLTQHPTPSLYRSKAATEWLTHLAPKISCVYYKPKGRYTSVHGIRIVHPLMTYNSFY